MYVHEKVLKTGIAGLDKVLIGFPHRSVILVKGKPGSGKSILCNHFVYKGLENNEPVIKVETNEGKNDFLESMKNIGVDIAKFFDKNLVRFIDVYSWTAAIQQAEEPGVVMCGSPSDLNDISVAISSVMRELREAPVKRLALDNLSTLLFYNNPENIIQFFTVLRGRLDTEGFTSLIVVEDGPHPPSIVASLEALADGVIVLDSDGDKRFLEVTKIRGMERPKGRIPFTITSKGMVV